MTDTQKMLQEMKQPGGLLRKFMSNEEIKVAEKLIAEGLAFKGTSDDRQKSVVYFSDK